MNFYDSIIEGGQRWPLKARRELNTAVLEYLHLGVEPDLDGMDQVAAGAFVMLRPVLDNQLQSADNGRKGGQKRAENARAKAEQSAKPPAKQSAKPPTKGASKGGTKPPTKGTSKAPNKQKPSAPSSGEQAALPTIGKPPTKPPAKQNPSEQEQERDREKPFTSVSGKERAKRPSPFVPPTVEDVARVARERNLTLVEPEEFWAHYDAQGWVLGNGNPMVSWESKLISWNSERRLRQQAQGGEGAYDAAYD